MPVVFIIENNYVKKSNPISSNVEATTHNEVNVNTNIYNVYALPRSSYDFVFGNQMVFTGLEVSIELTRIIEII